LLGKLAVLVAEHNEYKQRMLEVTEKVPSPGAQNRFLTARPILAAQP
jgi:hypothetical protein